MGSRASANYSLYIPTWSWYVLRTEVTLVNSVRLHNKIVFFVCCKFLSFILRVILALSKFIRLQFGRDRDSQSVSGCCWSTDQSQPRTNRLTVTAVRQHPLLWPGAISRSWTQVQRRHSPGKILSKCRGPSAGCVGLGWQSTDNGWLPRRAYSARVRFTMIMLTCLWIGDTLLRLLHHPQFFPAFSGILRVLGIRSYAKLMRRCYC